MGQAIYFQWQNDILRKTIYPLREMKLRDFLVFYQEIDLWKQYGGRAETDADIQVEIQAYKNAQVQLWLDALTSYSSYRGYFLQVLTEAACRERMALADLDVDELAKLNALHTVFSTWFPKVRNPRSENYFVSQRIYEWEQHRRDLAHQISECQRKMRNWASFPQFKKNYDQQAVLLQRLQNITLKMADVELDSLYAFLSICSRLEKRRTQLALERVASQQRKDALVRQAGILSLRLTPLQAQEAEALVELGRMKNPPDRAVLEQYFLTPIVAAPGPGASADVSAKIRDIHNALQLAFRLSKEAGGKLLAVQNQAWALKDYRKTVVQQIAVLESNLRNMPATWAPRAERQAQHDGLVAGLRSIDLELGRLDDFQAVLNQSGKTPAQTAALIQQKEKAHADLDANVVVLKGQMKTMQEQVQALDVSLAQSDQEKLAVFSPTEIVTVRDIARARAEAYRASLMPKDHVELLEMIVRRFLSDPERYPIWLQYMVVHFSGMRYASAHGSWADPKALLVNLRTSAIEGDYRKLDQDAVDALCTDKINFYEPDAADEKPGPAPQIPALAQTKDPRWRAKVEGHLKGVHSASPYYRRKALLDLLLDEVNYEVEVMADPQALAALESLKDSLPIPDWMWNEIVRLTQLRTQEVKDPNWESLTPEEQEDKESPKWDQFRQIMSQWEQANITGWRDEHADTDQLIVSRAVCNEVAEHIQHVRGNRPPGGLTAKPQWYLNLAGAASKGSQKASGSVSPSKGAQKDTDPESPYLLKASLGTLKQGASILWLRFVPDFPNEWRIAHPMKTSNGEDLLPGALFFGAESSLRGDWHYQFDSGTVKRTRSAVDANNQRFTEVQWLRWIHEATVVEVTETADGPTVLTFETALPYEDKRLSTIGVFKHDPSYVTYSVGPTAINGAFCGFAPQGDVPFENLENMLDWNKILLRDDALTPAALEAWRAKYLHKA